MLHATQLRVSAKHVTCLALLHIMYTYVYRSGSSNQLSCPLTIPSSHMDSVEDPCACTHVYLFVHTVMFAYDLMHMCMDNCVCICTFVYTSPVIVIVLVYDRIHIPNFYSLHIYVYMAR